MDSRHCGRDFLNSGRGFSFPVEGMGRGFLDTQENDFLNYKAMMQLNEPEGERWNKKRKN